MATAGAEDARMTLIGAIGCNLAWGLADAVMYFMTTLTERGRRFETGRSADLPGGTDS